MQHKLLSWVNCHVVIGCMAPKKPDRRRTDEKQRLIGHRARGRAGIGRIREARTVGMMKMAPTIDAGLHRAHYLSM